MSKTSFASDGEQLLYGLKKITLQNWQTPDIPRTFNITGEQWVQRVLEPKLSANVPEEVEKLFEVARGSMIYGWFYYALMTLAAEQLFRVCELAAKKRCEKASIPLFIPLKKGKTRDKTFFECIEDLVKAGIVPADEAIRWHTTRELRNLRSHPDSLMIDMPGNVCATLRITCDRINALFA